MEVLELYVKPFVDATLNTFKAFVGFELVAGHPHFSGRTLTFDQDISAVIGLSGDIRGAIVITMKKEFALKLADMLCGTGHTELDEDIVDALGEIVNIIAGNVKNEVPGGEKIVISLPTVIKGKDHSLAWPGKQSRILCISFRYEDDSFYVLVDMERIAEKG
ncbi:MAG: chemotaxis protein CheX [Treponema sp.]|jgi:chemotaxis protein CheX|nr:chemotaxis protein CheX [Treponema sp.]